MQLYYFLYNLTEIDILGKEITQDGNLVKVFCKEMGKMGNVMLDI